MKKFFKKYKRKLSLHLQTSITTIENQLVFAYQKRQKIGLFFPYTSRKNFEIRQLTNLAFGFTSWLLKKYTEKHLSIQPTDTVIDCGAFIGGFSIAASQSGAKQVYSIEPSSKNYKCLKLNIAYHSCRNITPINCGLGDKPGKMELNLSESGCDDSLLAPDYGSIGKKETVEIKTIQGIIEEYNLNPANLYLKVEAEGFEPEILRSLGEYKPRVITVDVTPERNGESPRELVKEILEAHSYKNFLHTERCLFAEN